MDSKINFKKGLLLFFIAYCIVTILATALSVTYGIVNHSAEPTAGMSALQAPAFVATVPYHVLIMLLVWPVFAWLYFRKPPKQTNQRKEVYQLAFLWLAAAILVDLVCFVLIRHPYSFTFYEFYVIYQPWISLIYLSIFLSPFIYLGCIKLFSKKALF